MCFNDLCYSNSRTCSVGYPFLFPLGTVSEYRFKDVFFRGKLNRISNKIIGAGGNKANEK